MALDGDVVVVVDPTQIGKSQVSSQRSSLPANALHHAPVAGQSIHVKVKELKVRLVVREASQWLANAIPTLVATP